MEFLIVDINAPYNAIMGRNWLGAIKAVASLFHQKLKFPSPKGIVEVRGSQDQARLYFYMAVRGNEPEHPQAKMKGKTESGPVQKSLTSGEESSGK
ncbi:hypothetical protein LguiA_005312 [Lonicera macranthoides]